MGMNWGMANEAMAELVQRCGKCVVMTFALRRRRRMPKVCELLAHRLERIRRGYAPCRDFTDAHMRGGDGNLAFRITDRIAPAR